MHHRFKWAALVAVSLSVAVGCGTSTELEPVQGTVSLDGAPLPDVQVLFYQPGEGKESNFIGYTDDQGRFSLTTLRKESQGAAPGKYQVQLTTAFAGLDAVETDPIPSERVPPKYRSFEYEIPEGGLPDIVFDMKSK